MGFIHVVTMCERHSAAALLSLAFWLIQVAECVEFLSSQRESDCSWLGSCENWLMHGTNVSGTHTGNISYMTFAWTSRLPVRPPCVNLLCSQWFKNMEPNRTCWVAFSQVCVWKKTQEKSQHFNQTYIRLIIFSFFIPDLSVFMHRMLVRVRFVQHITAKHTSWQSWSNSSSESIKKFIDVENVTRIDYLHHVMTKYEDVIL